MTGVGQLLAVHADRQMAVAAQPKSISTTAYCMQYSNGHKMLELGAPFCFRGR